MKGHLLPLVISLAAAKGPKRGEHDSVSKASSSEAIFGYQVIHPHVPFSRAASLCERHGHELATFNPSLTPLLLQALHNGKTGIVWMGSSSPANKAVAIKREKHGGRNFVASFVARGSSHLLERHAVLCRVTRLASSSSPSFPSKPSSSSSSSTNPPSSSSSLPSTTSPTSGSRNKDSTSSVPIVKRIYKHQPQPKKARAKPLKKLVSALKKPVKAKPKSKQRPAKPRRVHYELDEGFRRESSSSSPSESTNHYNDDHSRSRSHSHSHSSHSRGDNDHGCSESSPSERTRRRHRTHDPKHKGDGRRRRVAEQMKQSAKKPDEPRGTCQMRINGAAMDLQKPVPRKPSKKTSKK